MFAVNLLPAFGPPTRASPGGSAGVCPRSGRGHLAAAEEVIAGSRRRAAAGLGLFALSPVPSAQLFVAAGLLTVPLLPLTAAFFAGRLVSYSIYVGAASLAKESFGDALAAGVSSPLGIALQVAMLAGLVVLLRVDWAKKLAARRPGSRSGPA